MQLLDKARRAVRRFGWKAAARRGLAAVRGRLDARRHERRARAAARPRPASEVRRIAATLGLDPAVVDVIRSSGHGTLVARRGTGDREEYERTLVAERFKFIHSAVPKTIVDLSAGPGYAAVWYHARYPDARIVAVEPDADTVRVAEVNASLAPASNLVTVVHAVVGPIDADVVVTSGGNITEVPAGAPGAMRATTMTALAARCKLDIIDVLKVDVTETGPSLFCKDTEWLERVNAVIIGPQKALGSEGRDHLLGALDRHFVDYDEVVRDDLSLFTRRHRLPAHSSSSPTE